MADGTPQRHALIAGFDPVFVGTMACLFAAAAYTATNAVLRQLSGQYDAVPALRIWTLCVKEAVTVCVIGPWLVWQAARGRPVMPKRAAVGGLMAVGLGVQLAANLSLIWSFDVIGLGPSIAIALGVNLAASALLGWATLGERLTWQTIVAVGLLGISVFLLQVGAKLADVRIAASAGKVTLAVTACCVAGVMFSLLSVTIRKTITGSAPHASILFLITGMGVVTLGPLAVWQLGIQGILETTPADFGLMLLAGTLNLLAFAAITKGLQLTSVVRAGVFNASQVAMSAVTGILLFAEPATATILLGTTLTIVGMLLVHNRPPEPGESRP